MKLKIYSHGNKVLNQEGDWLEPDYPDLKELIDNMFETMYSANGIGLAAQQVGLAIKLFVVDLSDCGPHSVPGFKKVFINSEIIEESKEEQEFEEGCLSYPGLSLNIKRPKKIKLYYQDEDFNEYEEWFDGLQSIVIQHEHDHTEGITFNSLASPLKKRLIKSKLMDIAKGKVQGQYPMQIAKQ